MGGMDTAPPADGRTRSLSSLTCFSEITNSQSHLKLRLTSPLSAENHVISVSLEGQLLSPQRTELSAKGGSHTRLCTHTRCQGKALALQSSFRFPARLRGCRVAPTLLPPRAGTPDGHPHRMLRLSADAAAALAASAALRAHSLHWGHSAPPSGGSDRWTRTCAPSPRPPECRHGPTDAAPGLAPPPPAPPLSLPESVSPTTPCSRHHRTRSLSRRALVTE